MLKDFMAFLKQYGVVGLAIAVIIGEKLNLFISSLVNDLLMPILFQPALQAARVDDIRKLSINGILYGKVLGSALDFIIVALIIFLFAKYILHETRIQKK
ncbi:MAG: MscL family protein [Bdellovibrionales bacterium]|nr:MscL family protein [Bdellovibrionales bacterium]